MRLFLTCAAAMSLAAAAAAAEPSFAAKPVVKKAGEGAKIAFAAAAPTDVEVEVLSADGKTVRHLAAGMLGDRPPKPLKPGLAQELEWDGKDDLGKPAAGGPFRVRVALGLRPEFDRIIGWSPYALAGVNGVAAGPDGAVYFIHSGGLYAHRTTWLISAFDRDGKYLRQVYPGPAGLPAEKRRGWPRISPDGGPEVPVVGHLLPRTTYPGAVFGDRMFPLVTGDGRLVVLSAPGGGGIKYPDLRGGRRLLILGTDGSVPENFLGPEICPQIGGFGHLALSPDGRTVYVSGLVDAGRKGKARGPINVVYRVPLDGSKPAEAFIGKPYEKPDGPAGLSDPQGIDVDKDGNLYVADYDHGRVAVFKPDGGYLDEIKVECPDTVRVSRKTGAVYVLQLKKREKDFTDEHWANPGHNWAARRIAKFGGLRDKAEKAAWENSFKSRYGGGAYLALDDSEAEPVLWAAGLVYGGSTVLKLADRGGKLEVLGEPLAEALKAEKGEPLGFVGDVAVVGDKLLTQHPLYGQHGTFSLAYSATTGEYLGRYTPKDDKGKAEDMWTMTWGDAAGGGDGLMYYLVRNNLVRRYDAEGKPVPFASAGKHSLEGFWYGHTRGAGIFAGRDGTIWVPAGTGDRQIEEVKIKVIGADGKVLKDCAVQVQGARLGGIAADRAGNIYLGAHAAPKDERIPKAFAGKLPPDGPAHHPSYDYLHVGLLAKFPPEGGGIVKDDKGDFTATAQYNRTTVALRNSLWTRRLGYVGNHGHELGCHCETTRFDLDGHDRIFMPDPFRFRVCVLDTEGNEIASFGAYANADSRGPGSPVPEPAIPFGWPLSVDAAGGKAFVADVVNRRIVAVKFGHAAEETCEMK
ncbi:MAG TPA: hypothetical protein PK280_02640 [Planctomycetota bacterium]|nr:hypothetical protein [Planctomycetota bacterium]